MTMTAVGRSRFSRAITRSDYMAQVTSWYGAINASHTGIDVIAPEADLSPYKIVFAPLAYVMSEKQAAKIKSFVQAGGMFVTNFRLGVKNENSQIVRTPLPDSTRGHGSNGRRLCADLLGKECSEVRARTCRTGRRVRPVDGHSSTHRSRRCWRSTRKVHTREKPRSP